MKRKITIEEDDQLYESGRMDSFMTGMEGGFRIGGIIAIVFFFILLIVLFFI